MSMTFDLRDPVTKKILHTEKNHFMTGCNVPVGGTTEMTLDITYNYSDIINKVFTNDDDCDYCYTLNGKSGAESIPLLKEAISKLNDDVGTDYWQATEGNAKRALYHLLAFAQMRPDGVWVVY